MEEPEKEPDVECSGSVLPWVPLRWMIFVEN
jgi:hypothetical protein